MTSSALPDAGAPRRNGELVFEEPWQSRAFGIVAALAENRSCDYQEFRRRLIAEIGQWQANHDDPAAVYRYYDRWLAALQRLLEDRNMLSAGEIAIRARRLHEQDRHEHD